MIDINYILNRLKREEDIPLIKAVYDLSYKNLNNLYTYSNKSLFEQVLGVTEVLLDHKADAYTIAGNFLYMLMNVGFSKKKIGNLFGKDIADIAFGMWEFEDYSKANLADIMENIEQGERIVFIKLAKRIYDMQEKKDSCDEVKRRLANNSFETFIPAGRKMKFNYISSSLENLSLSYLEPEIYEEIVEKLGGPIDSLNNKLNTTKEQISKLLTDNNINHQIKGRVKGIYSIYNKLCSGKDFDDIYDILAIRILVDDEVDCQTVISLIHSEYEYLPDRVKNYIDTPKENMYQSLHTTIIDDAKRPCEIQVRTHEMNKTAETGSAAHSEYKKKQLMKNTSNY